MHTTIQKALTSEPYVYSGKEAEDGACSKTKLPNQILGEVLQN